MELVTRVQILDKTAFHFMLMPLEEKKHESSYSLPAMFK